MAEPPTTDDLIRKYLEREAAPAELAELERRLAQPECAEAFANACRLEAWLRILVKEESQVAQTRFLCTAIDNGRRRASRHAWRGVAVAVSILIICFGLGRFLARQSRQPPPLDSTKPELIVQQAPSQRSPSLDTGQGISPRTDNAPVAAAIAMLGIITANSVR
jgi:predicted anti-sigma-YlaC factor YlaD